jgi:hypothetical protein
MQEPRIGWQRVDLWEKGREQFVDCGYDMKNDHARLWWVRVFVAEVNGILSSLPPPSFNQLSMLVCLHLPCLCAREFHFDDLAKDMKGIPQSDVEIPGAAWHQLEWLLRSQGAAQEGDSYRCWVYCR